MCWWHNHSGYLRINVSRIRNKELLCQKKKRGGGGGEVSEEGDHDRRNQFLSICTYLWLHLELVPLPVSM